MIGLWEVIIAAATGQLGRNAASLAMPPALRRPEDLANLRPRTRQVFGVDPTDRVPQLGLRTGLGSRPVLAARRHATGGAWRLAGVDRRPLFLAPLRSTSLAEFWGRRWNLAFPR
jgi:hypothetical protein